jgi:uncharacterized membrane protein
MFKKIFILICFFIFFFSASSSVFAEEKSYLINSFNASIYVNTDSSVRVVEEITYDFKGEYHKGWRSILNNGISDISNIKVFDVNTGEELEFSPFRLDKTNSNNWGKYTYKKENGYTNIEWYYDAKDTIRTWRIEYNVFGLVSFFDDVDEIYWNVFTEYEVPILSSKVKVFPPVGALPEKIQFASYRLNDQDIVQETQYDSSVEFTGSNFNALEDYTVAVGWQKGVVFAKDFWFWWFKHNSGFIMGFLIIIFTILYSIFLWLKNEYLVKKDKSIVVQYEPPKGMKPAQMAYIYFEKMNGKVWPSTIIDLAVRGYIEIEEDNRKTKIGEIIFGVIFILIVSGITFSSLLKVFNLTDVLVTIFVIIIFFNLIFFSCKKLFINKDYIINIIKEYENDLELEEYEKKFLKALFSNRQTFSTNRMRSSRSASHDMYEKMQTIESKMGNWLIEEYAGIYTIPITKNKNRIFSFVGIFAIIFLLLFVSSFIVTLPVIGNILLQVGLILSSILISYLIYNIIYKSNPRLSVSGNDLWRNIAGFKKYLEVAEKYRMQNLTPDVFEKFLPYAMIFGVEKKWAKTFENVNMQLPSWYHSASHGSFSGSSFSAVGFSNSLSNSFSSSFGSSGASGSSGGGSGGGGGAGGGGGGGGGGAS